VAKIIILFKNDIHFCRLKIMRNFAPQKEVFFERMIIVPIKEGENIERALKKFKRKFEKTGVLRELRSRKNFTKKSVVRRDEIKSAIYRQKLRAEDF
jgi:small subunit ribosomal protein S21